MAEFAKLKQDSRKARELAVELAAIEKFIQRFRKQASNHVIAVRNFLESTKALTEGFKDFFHFARSDPFMTKVADDLNARTSTLTRELLRGLESEFEAQALPFLEDWTKEVNKTKTQLKLREAAKRRYLHYSTKLAGLAENTKVGSLSGKKQTQLKRNRLKLAHAKETYEKCCNQTWAAFDVCWDCQYTQANPLYAHTLDQEMNRLVSFQNCMVRFQEPLCSALNDSYRENQAKVQAHRRAADAESPAQQVDPAALEAEQHRMEAVQVEYDLHDMLATVLDGDITNAIQTITEDQLCSRMPIVGCVLASFPRRETIEALVQRAAASTAVAQAVGCLNGCFMVKPAKLLADVPVSRELSDFFLNFHTTIALSENCQGMDFKLPPNTFHPFQVGAPLKRIVVTKTFISNARPLLLAAYSEYEELPYEERVITKGRSSAFSLSTRSSSLSDLSPRTNPNAASAPPPLPSSPPPRKDSMNPPASPRKDSLNPPASPRLDSAPPLSPRKDSAGLPPSPRQDSMPSLPRKDSLSPSLPPRKDSSNLSLPRKDSIPVSSPTSQAAAERSPSSRKPPRPPLLPEMSASPEAGERKLEEKQSKPSMWWENLTVGRLPDLIFKYGDDLRTDQACQHLFRLMNHLWKAQKVLHKGEAVEAHVYKVQALSARMGLVEFVPGCIALSALTKQAAYEMKEGKINRIVCTSVGGYLAAFVLGIKDRHSDNILIKEDATVFHIDFGHVLGRGVTMDTGPFAITPEFKDVLEQWYSWHAFIEVCERAFLVLRLHANVIAEFATLLLRPIFPDTDIAAFVKKKLMVDMPLLDATLRLRKMVLSAPANYKTRLKNFVHGANQTLKTALS